MKKHTFADTARLAATFAILFQQVAGGSLAFAQDGAVVVGGAATISQQGADLNVLTHTDRTVINWDSFNINAGHTANFNQPGVNSAVLNRVVTPNNPSGIYGTLNSNGNVYLVNPSGVVVGPSGVINTNGFTASVLDISNKAFLDGGPLQFSGSSDASIINQGTIHTGSCGVALIGGQVINNGLIKSDGGSINLVTGGTVQLNAGGTYTQADQETLQNGISQTAGLIRNSGTLRATGALEVGGEVYLVSPGGTVLQEGLIAAAKQNNAGSETGGKVVITGDAVELNSATIDASAANGGGTVNIGGGFQGGDDSIVNSQSTVVDAGSLITANATESSDGGAVVLWSDGATSFAGQIYAQGAPLGSGGLVEVSGKQNLNFAGTVDTGGGQLLLDPFSYIVGATEAANIVAALISNNVTVQTSADDASQGSSGNNADPGDITVNENIFYDSIYDLTLLAHRHVNFNASVQNRNDSGGDINVVAGWDGTTAFNAAAFTAADVTSTTLFGNNNGSVIVGDKSQAAGVAVGSRSGNTNVFGYDVALQGGLGAGADGRFAQLGFQVTNGMAQDGTDLGAVPVVDGNIRVQTTNNITAIGGSTSWANYTQIGHVGGELSPTPNNTAEAAASSDIRITAAGNVRFLGGDGDGAYAQLGQGGLEADGNHQGRTTINRARDLSFIGGIGVAAYAQLGQGGFFAEGNHDGETTISRTRDIMFSAGSGDRAYAQLGQGGHLADGDHDGTTEITQARDIIFTGGDSTRTYAQLGQGGYNTQGSHMGTTTITRARDITFTGGSAEITYAQLGNGGDSSDGDHSGNTTITEARDITFTGGQANPDSSYAQLGHGGYDADGTHSGATTIALARDVTFTGGQARYGYAQLGHGGWDADGQHSGNIAVTMTGSLLLNGQNTRRSYAIIGHGDSPGGTDNGQTVSGNVTLSIGDDATLANAVIGHQIDAGGIYTGGNTFVAVGNNDLAGTNLTNKLTSDANSSINSAPNASGGELRLYLPRRDSLNMAYGATLNGVDVATFPATGPLPNEQGDFTPFSGPYSVNLADGNFAFYFPTIDLIVNANSGSSTYGDTPANPGLALIDGTLNAGETLGSIGMASSFNLMATSNAGTYVLTVDDSSLDPVYNLASSMNGSFTINPAALTITALNVVKPLGTTGVPNETTDFAATGLKSGETVGSVTLASTGYPATAGVGVYPIVISNPVGGTFDPANYNITLVNGNLLVTLAGSGISTYDKFIRYMDFFATVQSLLNPTIPPATNNPPTTQSDEENNSPDSVQPEDDDNNPQGDEIIIPEIRVTGV